MKSQRGKVKKRKRRGRRRGPGVILTLLCMVLIGAAIIAAMTMFFKIREIRVQGDSRYSREQIAKASEISAGENMFLFNKFAAISRIFAVCPYLDEISMRRILPDAIEITVTECVPVAVVSSDNQWYYIDAKGKILENIGESQINGYCRITGAGLLKPQVGKYVIFSEEEKRKPIFTILNSALNDGILKNIANIDVSQAFNIRLGYLDRFTVKLGTADQLDKKLQFVHYIEDKLLPTDRGIIDVSDVSTARFIPES